MSDSRPSPIGRQRGPARWRRLMRIGLWSIGAICLLVGLSLWLVTRSWFMIWQLGPQLERRLGGDVEIGSAVYERGGTLVFRDVTLRSRVHPGPAG